MPAANRHPPRVAQKRGPNKRNPFQEAAELEDRAQRLVQMAANMMAEAMRYDAMAAAIRLETRRVEQ